MKKSVSAKKNLRIYTLFTLAFVLISILFIFLGSFIKSITQKKEIDAPSSSTPVVIIDAGHGGEDCGAIGVDGTLEKDINLNISLKLAQLLNSANIPTVLTRNEDTMLYDKNSDYEGKKKRLDFQKRLEIINSYENAILISIHMNSFPQEKYDGLQVYFSSNSEESRIIADEIQSLTRELLQNENQRKTKPAGSSIYLLHKSKCPAVLIECGFLSNREECALLSTDEYQTKLAFVIYGALLNYLPEAEKL